MSKAEKRGFFSFFSRTSTKDEAQTEESGPSQEKNTSVLKNFSTKWFGEPEGKQTAKMKSLKEEPNTGDSNVAEQTETAQQPEDLEEIQRSLIGLLAKIGVPVAVAAAACVVLVKFIQA